MHIDTAALKEKAPDLLTLADPLTTLRKVGGAEGGEFAGPCPFCGGNDRFHIQPYHRPEARWLCRGCTEGKWKDVIEFVERRDNTDFMGAVRSLFGPSVQISPEDSARLQAERAARDAERMEQERQAVQEKQAELDQSGAWATFHDNLDTFDMRPLWHKRGLSDTWIDYFGLGFCPEKTYLHREELRKSPSLTIPTFRIERVMDGEPGDVLVRHCIGLAHRLLAPADPGDKYRPHLAGAGKPLFVTDLFCPVIVGDVLLVEGEIKAAVTWAAIQDWAWQDDETRRSRSIIRNTQVVGTPGKGFKAEWAPEFEQASRIWICMDPDVPGETLKKIGYSLGRERCRIVRLPGKIDDMLVEGSLQADDIADLMMAAKRI